MADKKSSKKAPPAPPWAPPSKSAPVAEKPPRIPSNAEIVDYIKSSAEELLPDSGFAEDEIALSLLFIRRACGALEARLVTPVDRSDSESSVIDFLS